ncbi:phage/plasmid primase, P4 family [Mesorhizobium sp. KR9-304]|uniref:DNA primase family protein n=1 Tax=Mesorhizobium sp. KR9-304 TaxID=3156614 RepID=UPI0032B44CCC
MQGDLLTLLYWRGSFWSWTGTHWSALGNDEIEALIYDFTDDALYRKPGGDTVPWNPNARRVHDVKHALKAVCRAPEELQPPCWLDGRELGPVVPCSNGLLAVDGRELLVHTPLFFNLNSLPYGYDPRADAPAWRDFTGQLWPDDDEPPAVLEECMGCAVAGKADLQRMAAIVGPPRSGKGTIFEVIKNLVGPPHTVSAQLSKLTDDKILVGLLGKSVCLIPDMRDAGRNPQAVAEVLLSITGQDDFTIDRKYKDPYFGPLSPFIFTASNELPSLRDASGALPSRYLPIIMTESFLGREDRTLRSRLLAELPGILNYALDGLDHVIKTGRFTEPKVSAEAAEDLAEMASPMKRFVAEHLAVMPKGGDPAEYIEPIADLFNTHRAWSRDNNEKPISRETFGQRLRAAVPTIKRSQPRGEGGVRIPSYIGVRLLRRETETARAKRHALAKLNERAGGRVRVIEGGGDDNDA